MQKFSRKILIVGPALAHWAEINIIEKSLQFLAPEFKLEFMDPLVKVTAETSAADFFTFWRNKVRGLIPNYDAIFGFSLGGVILQYCLDFFEDNRTPLILFSTPSFLNDDLRNRLRHIIQLIQDKFIIEALQMHNDYVFYPSEIPVDLKTNEIEQTGLRISKGLQFVLNADCLNMLKKIQTKYMHLVGEQSRLVNKDNVISSSNSEVLFVPASGMRVLQDNPKYCARHIIRFIQGYT